jgi:hypothetical protein
MKKFDRNERRALAYRGYRLRRISLRRPTNSALWHIEERTKFVGFVDLWIRRALLAASNRPFAFPSDWEDTICNLRP